jgi:hypothetical protein
MDLYQAYSNARQYGVELATIPMSWHSHLNLLPGHPRLSVVYVAHPTDKRKYFPVAEFHRLTFEHKFSELLFLLMNLGAKEIDVEHQRGWGRDFAVDMSVAIPVSAPEIGAKAGEQKGQTEKLLYHAEFDGNDSRKTPEDMVWFPHEPTWIQVAKGRMDFGLKKFSLQLNYLDDYSINAGLKVKVEKAGLDLGGQFKNHESTSWLIKGTF